MQAEGERTSIPTEPAPTDIPRQVRARTGRRLFAVALGLFLLLGALGFYGVRSRTATAAGGGYELSVRYGSVSRPGLATPWSFEVRKAGGFPDGLTVTVTSSYFDAFDENGLGPAPVEETVDGDLTVWRFGPTRSETLSVSFDARIEPGVQLATAKGELSVLGPDGRPAVTVDFKTFVMP
ncbi:MAG TPA: hypothetical protein VMZ73_04365 [Acidimicrobiales bacterium]|nr:hypothetical protein [Acidimicrobiales bacterium]